MRENNQSAILPMLLSQLLAGQATSARTRPVIILSLPCGAQKRQNPPRDVTESRTGDLGGAFRLNLLADDFKTTNGKEYKNATVSRLEADGIVLKTKLGISKVYLVELPKDVQERFMMPRNWQEL
jgi:hypothetical protein